MSIFFEDFNNLVSVSNSILRHYHIEGYHTSLAVLDQVLDQLNDKKICLVLLDGFGREIQEQYKGVYTIVAEKAVGNSLWGKLKSGAGWINLKYTKKV